MGARSAPRTTRSTSLLAAWKHGAESPLVYPASTGGKSEAPGSPPSVGGPVAPAVAGVERKRRWVDVEEDVASLSAKKKKAGVKPKATPDTPPTLPNALPLADEEGKARVATSQALIVEPPEPLKRPEAVVAAPLREGQALEGPQSIDAPMLAISEEPSEPPVARDTASLTTTPATALEAPQGEIHRTPVYVEGFLNEAFGALGKVAVVMEKCEKEANAARAAREEALKEAESAHAAHEEAMKEAKYARAVREEAMEGAVAAAKRCEEPETRLKAFQEEQAKLAELLRPREEELDARKTKLAAREEELSQEETRLGAKQARLDEQEKEIASKKTLLDAKEEALAAAEKKKPAELVGFPNVELRLRTTLHTLYRDGFDEPLATPGGGFAMLVAELAVALEDAVILVDKILESDCRDLFFEAATRIFSHLHLREPGFYFNSLILPVPTEARDSALEAVKGLVEPLVKRFAHAAVPPFLDAAEADDGEDDATDANDKPPDDGATGSGRSF
ncbi:hypothetical protein D1007_29769 [Hordeum vulgare]|nr:hypothetical protein D1007_29769 [Hordeum vulgare]